MVKRIKIIVPIPMDAKGVAARASQLPESLVLPGFAPEFVSVAKGAALGDSAYDMLLMDFSVVEAGLRAQEEGYAAVCIDTVSDSGLAALRSIRTRPDPEELFVGKEEVVSKRLEEEAFRMIEKDGADVYGCDCSRFHHNASVARMPGGEATGAHPESRSNCLQALRNLSWPWLGAQQKGLSAPQVPNDAVFHGFAH